MLLYIYSIKVYMAIYLFSTHLSGASVSCKLDSPGSPVTPTYDGMFNNLFAGMQRGVRSHYYPPER